MLPIHITLEHFPSAEEYFSLSLNIYIYISSESKEALICTILYLVETLLCNLKKVSPKASKWASWPPYCFLSAVMRACTQLFRTKAYTRLHKILHKILHTAYTRSVKAKVALMVCLF